MKNSCTEQKDLPRGTAGQVFLCSTQHRLRERRRCAAMRIGRRRRSMNDYVTVDRVKMTKLYPEGGAEAPPVADAAKICWRPRCAATRIRAPKYAPGKFFSLRSRPIDPLPAKTKKKDTRKCILLFWSGRRGSNSLPRPWQGRALPDELRPQNGASGRGRTGDTRIFSPLLYQLSYRGKLATKKGLEPSTSSVTGWRSNQLNYLAMRGGNNWTRTSDPLLVRQVL